MWTVYKHLCPDGMCYIGITSKDVKIRWGSTGVKYKQSPAFYNAIKKYGWNNISHIIVMTTSSKSEACYAEKYLIAWYKAKGLSFNVASGGFGSPGVKMPEMTRMGIREANQKQVAQYKLDGTFVRFWDCAADASRFYGLKKGAVPQCCQGRHKTAAKYQWRYASSTDNITPVTTYNRTKIGMYDKSGNLLRIFETAAEVERILHCSPSQIIACCKNKYPFAHGYKWKYMEE